VVILTNPLQPCSIEQCHHSTWTCSDGNRYRRWAETHPCCWACWEMMSPTSRNFAPGFTSAIAFCKHCSSMPGHPQPQLSRHYSRKTIDHTTVRSTVTLCSCCHSCQGISLSYACKAIDHSRGVSRDDHILLNKCSQQMSQHAMMCIVMLDVLMTGISKRCKAYSLQNGLRPAWLMSEERQAQVQVNQWCVSVTRTRGRQLRRALHHEQP